MIRIICGQPRAGKTALMTCFAVQHMRGKQAKQDLKRSAKLIAPLNASGFAYTLPPDHVVFSNYTILGNRCGSVTSYELEPFHMGLSVDQNDTLFLPPGACLAIDESQTFYNSRNKDLADYVSLYYQWHGHYRLNIDLAAQRPKQIDLNIRELAGEVLYVEKLEHALDNGRIAASQWTCSFFDNAASAIAYIDGGLVPTLRGDTVRFTFTGNIFRHYNSYDYFPAFLKDNYDSEFSLRHAIQTGYSRDAIMDFNDQHDYVVPDDYYKKKR